MRETICTIHTKFIFLGAQNDTLYYLYAKSTAFTAGSHLSTKMQMRHIPSVSIQTHATLRHMPLVPNYKHITKMSVRQRVKYSEMAIFKVFLCLF